MTGMKLLTEQYHTYQNENRICEVWKTEEGDWATRHYKKDGGRVWLKDVVHRGHSERWAEDAAENWVLEINS